MQSHTTHTLNRYKTLKRFYNKVFMQWLKVATVELNMK